MRRSGAWLLVAMMLAAGSFAQAGGVEGMVIPQSRATTPWKSKDHAQRMEMIGELAKKADYDLVFVGDSITHCWDWPEGVETWKKYYAHRRPLNFGIGGDETGNVLWRIERGDFDVIRPKLIVLLIGTNNTGRGKMQKPQEIRDGIAAVLQQLRKKQPQSKILLLAIFPRDQKPDGAKRLNNLAVNKLIAPLADGDTIHYLDIGPTFLAPDGTIPQEIMKDYLHLTARGYQLWAEAIEPMVAELMGEKK